MCTNKKSRTDSAQPQKNSHLNNTPYSALSQLPILIDLHLKARRGKAANYYLIEGMRKCGFTRRQIEKAIDDYILAGKGVFVIHQYMVNEHIGMYVYSNLRQRLEIWRQPEVKP